MTATSEADAAIGKQQPAPAAVVFDRVSKAYAGSGPRAVNDVSFEVREGELLVLLGPSGCGKTTSLRMIAGLEQNDRGTISLAGRVVSSPDRGLFVPPEKRNIGMVFQSYAIWPHMTVLQNVAYPLRVRGVSKKSVRGRVEEVLDLVGLEGMADRPATKLSGGQQQRVALARALVFQPDLLLLDEPLSNLDAKLRGRMRTELKELQRKTGVAAVFVTHDQAESMALADRIVVMNEGKVEQIGTPADIYERPATQFVAQFIGSTNLIAAQSVPGEAPESLVRVRFATTGHEVCGRPVAGVPLGAGAEVYVVIRPEHLDLRADPPDARAPGAGGLVNVWRSVVQSATYYGDRREYQVVVSDAALKDAVLTISAPQTVIFAPGDAAYVVCRSDDVVVAAASN